VLHEPSHLISALGWDTLMSVRAGGETSIAPSQPPAPFVQAIDQATVKLKAVPLPAAWKSAAPLTRVVMLEHTQGAVKPRSTTFDTFASDGPFTPGIDPVGASPARYITPLPPATPSALTLAGSRTWPTSAGHAALPLCVTVMPPADCTVRAAKSGHAAW
jgi:hypothetical protein